MPKITKRVVDTLEPKAKEFHIWDSEIKGFGVRMSPTGLGTYLIQYRNSENRLRKLKLGRVGTLTPEQARKEARIKLAEISQGADPSAERQQIRRTITVAELCDLYQEDTKGRVKEATYSTNGSQIEAHIKPLIGRLTVTSLTAADATRMMNDIIAGKTAKARTGRGGVTTGGKGAANRTMAVLSAMLEFAKRRKIINENVARDVQKPVAGKQSRFLTEDEIRRLGAVMREIAEVENPIALAAIRFALLTGCRKDEVLSLPWQWLDEKGGCIRFGDTKTGAQIRPIGKTAFEVLKNLPQAGKWVFPATRGDGHFIGMRKALDRLCKRADLEGGNYSRA